MDKNETMRNYKVRSKIRILAIGYVLLMCILFSFIVLYSKPLSRETFLGISGIIFFVLCAYVACNLRIIIDAEKIQSIIDFKLFQISQQVYWKNVDQINVDYFLNPSILTNLTLHAPVDILYGFKKYQKETMTITSITLFSTDLLDDILSKVPVNAEIYMTPELKNRFVRRYGAEVIQRFDNIGKSAYEPIPKGGIFTIKFFMRYLKVYVLCLIGFALYNYFAGHKVASVQEISVLLITAFFLSLVYGIYWWFFGGNSSKN